VTPPSRKATQFPEPPAGEPQGRSIMDIQTATDFFMWCTIINGTLVVFWVTMCVLASDLVYRMQRVFFPIPRETFNVVIYSFLGLFKIVYLVFNVVPFVALLIVGR
jgi:hypothetical protein